MNDYILFVFEGEDTETQIFESLKEYFFKKQQTLIASYKSNIHILYKQIKDDEYLDFFELLKEQGKVDQNYSDITSDEISSTFIFFDHDAHCSEAKESDIRRMLRLFSNETESEGKLYISYPMCEALKHISSELEFKDTVCGISENLSYKDRISKEADNDLLNFKNYSKRTWDRINNEHIKKMNFIVNDKFEQPEKNISQIQIYDKQLSKYIVSHEAVSVLSAFPIFLFENADLLVK